MCLRFAVGCTPSDHAGLEPTRAALASQPPNIIFILTDDLNEEVFSHQTRLNSLLAANGTTFKNHFVSLSLCCPSRTATLRGQYAHNSGIFTNSSPDGGFAKVFNDGLESSTIATWLQAAGYRTALIGKYLNGYPNGAPSNTYIPPGWTRWFSPNGGNPYSEFNYDLNENGTTVSYGSAPEDYLVDVIAQKTTTFINNTLTNFPNKPFFVYVAPFVPHGPATPPPRYVDQFPGAQAPRTASFNEADVSDKPAWVQSKPRLTATQIAAIDDLYRKRLQTMLAVEDLVSNVIDTLTARGQLDNTYIFFTSDNGFHQGQHRLTSGKNTAFDEDLLVPLIVRGPGVPAGQVVTKITANIDLASTWAEIAAITPPSFVDGRSLIPFLTGATPAVWRKTLLLEHAGPSITAFSTDGLLEPQDAFDIQAATSGGAAPIFVGLRTPVRTYVEYDTGERELYENTTDPDQLNNAYSTADPALKTKFTTWVGNLRNCVGAGCRSAEENPPQ
ncbi:MAG TPA: sulfatase [Kofleriaceae bacterium]|nr:sulfatase [Kofleriaceae bacterium]